MTFDTAFASAAVPQGRIAYTAVDSGDWVVRVVNPDGTDKRTVYRCPINSCELKLGYQAWDPTGQRLVVEQWTRVACPGGDPPHPGDPPPPPRDDLYGCIANPVVWQVINVDSGVVQQVAPPGLNDLWGLAHDGIPFWSPNGQWIAFTGVHHTDPPPPTTANVIFDPYIVHPDGSGQTLMQVGSISPSLVSGYVSGWTPGNQVIVGTGIGFNRFNPATGLNAGVLSLNGSLVASVAPNGSLIGLGGLTFENTSTFEVFTVDGSEVTAGVSWAPDSSEVAYIVGQSVGGGIPSFPGPNPVKARAPTPHSMTRTVVPDEYAFGYVSWSPPTDPKVTIDTPVEGQEITGRESTQTEKDAVRLKGSVSSGSTPAGWCFSVQQPSAPDPPTPTKPNCTQSFGPTSVVGGRTTSKFETDLGPLVGNLLKPGENTVWVWGYGVSADAGVAKVKLKVSPSYYIKHLEVAQALSPIERFSDLGDPLQATPYTPTWATPTVAGFPIALIAGRETFIRVYAGDANLAGGATSDRTIRVRVSLDGNKVFERDVPFKVSAVDRPPDQRDPTAGAIVRLPPNLTSALTGPANLEVEVNPGQLEPECPNCYPNGNLATLSGIAFEQGADLTLTPVPINFKTATGKFVPDPGYNGIEKAAGEYLPLGDSEVHVTAPRPALDLDMADVNGIVNTALSRVIKNARCAWILTQLDDLRRTVPDPATVRWVGKGSPPSYVGCLAYSLRPGSSIVLLQPFPDTLAHEIGHTLGLGHTLSLIGKPDGAEALPYVGIGGIGYRATGLMEPEFNSDLMGYTQLTPSTHKNDVWTSPATWFRMHTAIVARIARLRVRAPGSSRVAAQSGAPSLARRRLVNGFIAGGSGQIFSSLVVDATADDHHGPVEGRVVALDQHGHKIATAPVTGTPLGEDGSRPVLPFVVALPSTASAASLQLQTPKGMRMATLRRSPHRPAGHFVRLPRRAPRSRALTVRWAATDKDHDRLTVILQGRLAGPWSPLARAPGSSRAKLVPKSLGRGKKLRLRLLVSDGFNTRTVKAKPVKLTGR